MRVVRTYLIRHQAAGLLTDRVYALQPTQDDLSEAWERCAGQFGFFSKRGMPWAMSVEETCLILPWRDWEGEDVDLPAEAPPVAEPSSPGASARLQIIGSSAAGSVTNP